MPSSSPASFPQHPVASQRLAGSSGQSRRGCSGSLLQRVSEGRVQKPPLVHGFGTWVSSRHLTSNTHARYSQEKILSNGDATACWGHPSHLPPGTRPLLPSDQQTAHDGGPASWTTSDASGLSLCSPQFDPEAGIEVPVAYSGSQGQISESVLSAHHSVGGCGGLSPPAQQRTPRHFQAQGGYPRQVLPRQEGTVPAVALATAVVRWLLVAGSQRPPPKRQEEKT